MTLSNRHKGAPKIAGVPVGAAGITFDGRADGL